MNETNTKTAKIDQKEIGQLAYQLWEKAGRPAGMDLNFWLEAESQLRQAAQPIPTIPVKLPPSQPKEPVASKRAKLGRAFSNRLGRL